MTKKSRESSAGWVYAVSNPSMPGILKIGRTARDPQARLKEMNGRTETPTPFAIEAVVRSSNAAWTERAVHERLQASRLNDRREFFKVTPREALSAMRAVASAQRQTAFDRRSWDGSPPFVGAGAMTALIIPVAAALDARLVLPWAGACAVAAVAGRPRFLVEYLNISRRTGTLPLLPMAACAIGFWIVFQDATGSFEWVARAAQGLSLAAVRGTIGL